MRDLTKTETQHVSGGLFPLLQALALGYAVGYMIGERIADNSAGSCSP